MSTATPTTKALNTRNLVDGAAGASAADSGPSAAELARAAALADVGSRDVGPSRSEMAQSERRRAEQADAQLRRDLDNLTQLAQGARDIIAGKRQESEKAHAAQQSARLAQMQQQRAAADSKPVAPKEPQQPAQGTPPANAPSKAEQAKNGQNPNAGQQQQGGRDGRNASRFEAGVQPYAKLAAGALATLSAGKKPDANPQEKLSPKLQALLAAKQGNKAGDAPAKSAAVTTPPVPGEQKPAEAHAAQQLAKGARFVRPGHDTKDARKKEAQSDGDGGDSVADAGSASPTAGSAAVASEQRVERKGDGGDGNPSGDDEARQLAQLQALNSAPRAFPVVSHFGAAGDNDAWRVTAELNARAGLSAVTQSAFASVAGDVDGVRWMRAGLEARILMTPGMSELAVLLQARLNTANARIG